MDQLATVRPKFWIKRFLAALSSVKSHDVFQNTSLNKTGLRERMALNIKESPSGMEMEITA